ncbi:MAG: GlmU family protein [Bacteroidota bacterium]|jgi:UDP-N-acetylglucosamine diphosphorylase/glucosamine-1-phosphate N-acetyltransferase
MHICIFEDSHAKNFHPLTHLRPVYDLHCGTLSLRSRIEQFVPARRIVYHARPFLAGYIQEQRPSRPVNDFPEDDTWFINGRLLMNQSVKKVIQHIRSEEKIFLAGNEVALACVRREHIRQITQPLRTEFLHRHVFESFPAEQLDCSLIQYPWELVAHNAAEIESDFRMSVKISRRKSAFGMVYKGAHLLNRKNISIGAESVVMPGAVLNAEKGPIIIGDCVTVMPNSFLEGPLYIGDHSLIKAGAKIYHGTSIGPHCKVGGEVENSIVQSYSNKQHEGFLGHSYLGSWINIGADTNNSDLKNTYGSVKVVVNGKTVDTGMQFVGLTMGDHSKTGINMMFDTGTVVGISSNLYGAGLPPKFVPSFSWGSPGSLSVFELEKSLEIARRMMARRDVRMSSAYETMMRHAFAATDDERRQALSGT